ncbi:MAG: hypothetical protein M9916_13335 [Crocinitomicaceae bacterium]|nr:hypothetical protein [Crocinitomicaceae bacterium]
MKKFFNVTVSLLSGIVLLLILWGLYISLFLYSFQSKAPKQHYFAPNDAEIVLEFDGRDVLFNFLNNTFVKGKGNEIVHLLKKVSKEEGKQKDFGINWLQPITYFKTTYKSQEVQGIIVQIINPISWSDNSLQFFNKNSFSTHTDNSGIIVQSEHLSQKELKSFTYSLYQKEITFGKKVADNHIIHFKSNVKMGKSNLDIAINDTSIVSTGQIILNKDYTTDYIQFKLTPSDFHITTDIVTKEINDTLQNLIGTNLTLGGVSMNYRGVLVDNINNKMAIIPDADFVLTFKDATTIDQFVETIPNAAFNIEKDKVIIGKRIFYIKQLTANSIYFGKTANAELHPNHVHFGVLIKGSLASLVAIDGSKLVQALIKMSSPYKLASELSNEVKSCVIEMNSVDSITYSLKSTIRFKGEDASLSILKVLLTASIE